MTTYKKCKAIRDLIVKKVMEGYVYRQHWGADFRLKDFDKIEEIVTSWENDETGSLKIQPADLTKEEMKDLGFGQWSKDAPMWLIPIWLFPFLADEIQCSCIDGTKGILKKQEMDTDNRFGMLAYGVYPRVETTIN